MDRVLYRARMPYPRERIEELLEAAAFLEPAPTSWEDLETGAAWIETYDADRSALAARALRIADLAGALDGAVHAATLEPLADADWKEAWKRHFHTTRISPRIVIHPSWEPPASQDGDVVVELDPGLSFGTGLHPTTRACLRILDRIAAALPDPGAWSVTDLGCGSGILAIAAAKLGFGSVNALDHDPQAVRVSLANLARNAIPATRVRCSTADVLHDPLPPGDLVLANILAPVLIEATPAIARAVRPHPDASLVLSGILVSQFAEVEAAFVRQGFVLDETRQEEDWRTGCFRRRKGTLA